MTALPSDTRHLVDVVQRLSLARDMNEVMRLVRGAARVLTGSDGATFVLRDHNEDGGLCYYADEDAIGPLWKGSRFPISACISGWCMIHREPVAIEDIFADDRIPLDLYRTTFVKSLLMVPIRTLEPIGAIGNYWAQQHRTTERELSLMQALADSASIAIENVRLYQTLERRVTDRTAELVATNAELDAFTASASHDLRSPLAGVSAAAQALLQHADEPATVREVAALMLQSTARMQRLVTDLLDLSRTGRAEMARAHVDLSALAREVVEARRGTGSAELAIHVDADVFVDADPGLLRIILDNLIANALKFSRDRHPAVVRVGAVKEEGGVAFFVADNGAGFATSRADKLFTPFQRLHSSAEFEGTGIGLATVARAVRRHGGRVWADGEPGKGATFWFTLAPREDSEALAAVSSSSSSVAVSAASTSAML